MGANSPSNLAISDQFAVMCSSAAAVVSAEFCGGVAPLTVKLEPGSAWNTAPMRWITDPVMGPGQAATQNDRHVVPHGQIVEARAELAAGVGRAHRVIGQAKAAAREIRLAVARGVEALHL